jgi:chemotaxis signal transduction protein
VSTRPTQPPLLDSREALTSYLDSLFNNVPIVDVEASAPAVAVVAAAATAAPVVEVVPDHEAERHIPTEPMACAVMRAGDFRLAVPLVELHGIRRQSERLTKLPGLPGWVLGVCGSGGPRLQVVDTAQLLGGRAATEYQELHIVIVAQGRWALACNGVEKTVTVAPAAVRWRTRRQEDSPGDPWFAGMITDELCPYVDVQGLVRWLDGGAGRC